MHHSIDAPDINDVFDSLATAEETISEKSFDEGRAKGEVDGRLEGYHLGFHRGAEIGSEVGYYCGFADFYLKFGAGKLSTKTTGELNRLKQLAESVPKMNDPNVDILSLVEQCRASFKKVCVHLKISPRLPNPAIE
ncbi:Oral cancer overexpressed 1 [Nesidiocoris tenuis]|uniref:Oral cancer overexpressed 1 n=1 Tax=Nesidiocoris tenuis TaxID=355587 RepID=A0ABN7B119_9HEMI|nr:Oral cancer overexpressed 1 [Nesidiocoris tenuis]